MKITFPLVPIEIEITARRRTERFRVRVRTLMILVAVVATVVYLLLPLSTADQRRMVIFEQLANTDPKPGLTMAQVVSQIGPPTMCDIPPSPNSCTGYVWVAHFVRPMSYQEFELRLSIDPDTDLVAAWGLDKKEYQGLELILFRIGQLMGRIGL
jgi:hypothetical protein